MIDKFVMLSHVVQMIQMTIQESRQSQEQGSPEVLGSDMVWSRSEPEWQ